MPPDNHPMQKFLRAIGAFLNVLLVLLTLAALVVALAKPSWVEAAVEWAGTVVRGLGNWNYLVLLATAAVESFPFLGTAVPGQNVMIVTAGFFAPGDIAGSVACAAVGACLGNWLGFALGRAWGPQLVEKYGHWFGLGETEIRWLRKGLETKGFWFVALGKFHNFFRSFVPFVAGTAGMKPRSFWLYNIVGSVLWAGAMVAVGVWAVANYQLFLRYFQYVVLAVLLGYAAYAWFFRREQVKKYWAEKVAEVETKAGGK